MFGLDCPSGLQGFGLGPEARSPAARPDDDPYGLLAALGPAGAGDLAALASWLARDYAQRGRPGAPLVPQLESSSGGAPEPRGARSSGPRGLARSPALGSEAAPKAAPRGFGPSPGALGLASEVDDAEGDEAAERRARTPEEACAECGGQMRRRACDLGYDCSGCGLILEGDTAEPSEDDAPRPAPSSGLLRIVGPNSNKLQPDLYRSGAGTTAASQKKQILEEYKAYRAYYIEASGRAFPLNACELAAEYYGDVQRECVKRSQNKKAIMAACLWRACHAKGYAPSKAEVAAFMQLATKGIARGDNFVRALIANGSMDLEANVDSCRPEIGTLFAHLAYEGAQYAGLREAVYEVVQAAIRNNIGTNSFLRSKVAGATFAVLRRCRDRALVPRAPSMQEFCQNRIRKNTIDRFLSALKNYHSYFEEVYRKYGLDDSPPAA